MSSKTSLVKNSIIVTFFVFLATLEVCTNDLSAQSKDNQDQKLLDKYINSKNSSSFIVFDSSNMKQFWIDKSVFCDKNKIFIQLKNKESNIFKSSPLKIQLANINDMFDCNIDIYSLDSKIDFSISNSRNMTIASSAQEDTFINYSVSSSFFHLKDTPDNAFYLSFLSATSNLISIDKIVLSFSQNKERLPLATRDKFILTRDKINLTDAAFTNDDFISQKLDTFSVNGKRSRIVSQQKIFISDRPVSVGVKIKNIGDQSTKIYVGFSPFAKNNNRIESRSTPYGNNNRVLRVIDAQKGNTTIQVDSYPEWKKGCLLVRDAKEDLSDYPNSLFIGGEIVDIQKDDNGHAVISLSKPLSTSLEKGSFVRIQAPSGSSYLYADQLTLNPQEEVVIFSELQRDDSCFQYSPQSFPHGTDYVLPVILSFSVDPEQDNTVSISDYYIMY